MTIYFAYGSNLNRARMHSRCPQAKSLGRFFLSEAALVFRGVADCVPQKGSRCPGALWRLSPLDEKTLDEREGFNPDDPAAGSYRKIHVALNGFPGEDRLMLYVMNSTGIMPPTIAYINVLRSGYRDFKLPPRYLDDAIADSWLRKNPSHRERKRIARDGTLLLARPLNSNFSAAN